MQEETAVFKLNVSHNGIKRKAMKAVWKFTGVTLVDITEKGKLKVRGKFDKVGMGLKLKKIDKSVDIIDLKRNAEKNYSHGISSGTSSSNGGNVPKMQQIILEVVDVRKANTVIWEFPGVTSVEVKEANQLVVKGEFNNLEMVKKLKKKDKHVNVVNIEENVEAARAEKRRIEKEEAARAERRRIEKEEAAKAERRRIEKEKIERAERRRIEKEEAARAERRRIEKEKAARAERRRIEKEEAVKAERRRIEKKEAARAERRRIEKEKAAREERRRIEKEKAAREERRCIEKEKAEKAERRRIEKEEAARAESRRIEKEKAAKAERRRIEKEKAAKSRKARY